MWKRVPTFDEGAAASTFLHQTAVQGLWLLRERTRGVQFAHAVAGTLEEGLGVVDGADGPGQRWRGAAVALVHPGPVPHALQLTLHLPGQVALGPVVEALHAAGHLDFLAS